MGRLGSGGGGGGSVSGVTVVGLCCVRDEKASGTHGGASSAATWNTRDLNVKPVDTIGVTLAANVITLPAGTYNVRASAQAFKTNSHKTRLYDTTNSTTLLVGRSSASNSADNSSTSSQTVGQFTLAGEADVELQHYTSAAVASNGLGNAASASVVEVYAEVWLEKVAD